MEWSQSAKPWAHSTWELFAPKYVGRENVAMHTVSSLQSTRWCFTVHFPFCNLLVIHHFLWADKGPKIWIGQPQWIYSISFSCSEVLFSAGGPLSEAGQYLLHNYPFFSSISSECDYTVHVKWNHEMWNMDYHCQFLGNRAQEIVRSWAIINTASPRRFSVECAYRWLRDWLGCLMKHLGYFMAPLIISARCEHMWARQSWCWLTAVRHTKWDHRCV